jgi:hypothetical protein
MLQELENPEESSREWNTEVWSDRLGRNHDPSFRKREVCILVLLPKANFQQAVVELSVGRWSVS